MGFKGALPEEFLSKIVFMAKAYTDLWIISGFISAFFASMTWAAAMTKFQLSQAYPFMSLSFILVFIFSVLFFNEDFTYQKLIGILLIVAALITMTSGKFFS